MKDIDMEVVSLEKINPVPWNPRKNLKPGDPEYEKIKRSLKEFGYVDPLVVNRRNWNLVGGHQRLKIMKAEGMKEARVSMVDLDEQKEALLNIALNRIRGRDDVPKLKSLIFELEGIGVDVTVAGLDLEEIAQLLNRDHEPTTKDDLVPDPPAEARAALGDVWELGEHRLFVGDATKPESYAALDLQTHSPAMIFTAPPNGVSYNTKSGELEVIEDEEKRDDELLKMLTLAFKEAEKVAMTNAAFYIWHASITREDFGRALKAAGLMERQYLIWAKQSTGLGHSDYSWAHEPCFYASKQGSRPAFYGDRAQPTVLRATLTKGVETATTLGSGVVLLDGRGGSILVTTKLPKAKKIRKIRLEGDQAAYLQIEGGMGSDVWEVAKAQNYKHPTQKPVELAVRSIQNSSKPGEVVLDMFCGSGTTVIAAEKTARRAFVFELDPRYADVIIARWEAFTNRKADKVTESAAA